MINNIWFFPIWTVFWMAFLFFGLKLIRRKHERRCQDTIDKMVKATEEYRAEITADIRTAEGRFLTGEHTNLIVMYSIATPLGDDVVLAARHHGDVGSLSTSISFEVYVTHGEKRLIIETLGTGFTRSQDAEKCVENFMRKYAIYNAVKAISLEDDDD